MPYSFDYLTATLRCARCGRLGPTLDMITRLRDEPQLDSLGVGDALPVTTANALNSGYLLVREPVPGEPIVLLHTWTCSHCGYADNWALVTVADGVIESIREAALDQRSLAAAQFVVDDVQEIAADLAGVPSPELDGAQVIAILRERLPSS